MDKNTDEQLESGPVSLNLLTAYRMELLERLLDLVQLQNQAIARFSDDRPALVLALEQILSDMAVATEEHQRIDMIIADIINAVDQPLRSIIDGTEEDRNVD